MARKRERNNQNKTFKPFAIITLVACEPGAVKMGEMHPDSGRQLHSRVLEKFFPLDAAAPTRHSLKGFALAWVTWLFLDKLSTVDHASGTNIFPDHGLSQWCTL